MTEKLQSFDLSSIFYCNPPKLCPRRHCFFCVDASFRHPRYLGEVTWCSIIFCNYLMELVLMQHLTDANIRCARAYAMLERASETALHDLLISQGYPIALYVRSALSYTN